MIETLVNFINFEERDTAYTVVAKYIITHLDQVVEMKLEELAEACYVAPSTISRFCRNFGYSNYTQFRLILQKSIFDAQKRKAAVRFPLKKYSSYREQLVDYSHMIGQGLLDFTENVDIQQLEKFAQLLREYEDILFVDISYALMYAHNLQASLAIQNKFIKCYMSQDRQIGAMKLLKQNSLIVAFAYDIGVEIYPDKVYDTLRSCPCKKILVTTGAFKDDCIFDMVIDLGMCGKNSQIVKYVMVFFVEAVISAFYKMKDC